ncbi:hypothetical protein Hanom_Chr09g00808021 [Helianthus anomalus]
MLYLICNYWLCMLCDIISKQNITCNLYHFSVHNCYALCVAHLQSYYLPLPFRRLRKVITSSCLSPSTSANLRLTSEYFSCISFSSFSMCLFFSFNADISLNNLLSFCSKNRPSLLENTKEKESLSVCISMRQWMLVKTTNCAFF